MDIRTQRNLYKHLKKNKIRKNKIYLSYELKLDS